MLVRWFWRDGRLQSQGCEGHLCWAIWASIYGWAAVSVLNCDGGGDLTEGPLVDFILHSPCIAMM